MKLIKAFYIDVEAQKVSELHVVLRLDNFYYFLKGERIIVFCLGEEAEFMLYLNSQNFKRKKAGFFKLNDLSEELYPGNAILVSLDPNFYKSLVFEDMEIEIEEFTKSVTFYRPNQVSNTDIKAKAKQDCK
jgi:hypothetical protein